MTPSRAAVAASVVMTVVGLILLSAPPRDLIPVGWHFEDVVHYLVLQVALTGVAGLLVWRRPGHRIGSFMSIVSFVSAIQFVLAGYALVAVFEPALPGAALSAWTYTWMGFVLGISMTAVVATFPDGRLVTRSARAGFFVASFSCLAGALVLGLRPGPLTNMRIIDNPLGWDDGAGLLETISVLVPLGVAVGTLLILASLLRRYRLANAVERQQLKWFLWCIFFVVPLLAFTAPSFISAPDPRGSDDASRYAARLLTALGMSAVPIAIGIAVVRYRLYDIDVIIRRTLVYGVVSSLSVVIYAGAVVVLQAVLRPYTGSSAIAVAASTLLVVALFQPLRGRVQEIVDRRFYRGRYDAVRTIDAFSIRLRDEVDLDAVRAELVDTVQRTMQPVHASVWLR